MSKPEVIDCWDKTGGPAFPSGPSDAWMTDTPHGGGGWASSYGIETPQGMTLRDYFAVRCLQAIMSHEAPVHKTPDQAYADAARSSYKIADAMIAERSKATKQA